MSLRIASVLAGVLLQAGFACAGGSCAAPVGCQGCGERPIIVHVIPKYVAAPCKRTPPLCHCLPPPRARVLDTVAVERVAAPFLRQELVVSREQLRVVPLVAEERLGEPLRDRQLRSECGTQPEADRSRAAPATEDSLEQRLSRLEQGLATIKQLMVEERKRELERLP
jgi:hypothetical protein